MRENFEYFEVNQCLVVKQTVDCNQTSTQIQTERQCLECEPIGGTQSMSCRRLQLIDQSYGRNTGLPFPMLALMVTAIHVRVFHGLIGLVRELSLVSDEWVCGLA